MKERPILFSGPMVRAILSGRKTVTRRVVGLPLRDRTVGCELSPAELGERELRELSPYGTAGDRLWVRETHSPLDEMGQLCAARAAAFVVHRDGTQVYRSGEVHPALPEYAPGAFDHIKWRPSIHMPRWAARLLLEVTGVRVELLHSMCELDAENEGVQSNLEARTLAVQEFAHLWDGLNAKRGFGWAANPWVWVVEFRKLEVTA